MSHSVDESINLSYLESIRKQFDKEEYQVPYLIIQFYKPTMKRRHRICDRESEKEYH